MLTKLNTIKNLRRGGTAWKRSRQGVKVIGLLSSFLLADNDEFSITSDERVTKSRRSNDLHLGYLWAPFVVGYQTFVLPSGWQVP